MAFSWMVEFSWQSAKWLTINVYDWYINGRVFMTWRQMVDCIHVYMTYTWMVEFSWNWWSGSPAITCGHDHRWSAVMWSSVILIISDQDDQWLMIWDRWSMNDDHDYQESSLIMKISNQDHHWTSVIVIIDDNHHQLFWSSIIKIISDCYHQWV